MRSLLVAAALTAVVLWIGKRIWKRPHELRDSVSPRWLSENAYDKWGDRRWK
jgi:hypothetical protein